MSEPGDRIKLDSKTVHHDLKDLPKVKRGFWTRHICEAVAVGGFKVGAVGLCKNGNSWDLTHLRSGWRIGTVRAPLAVAKEVAALICLEFPITEPSLVWVDELSEFCGPGGVSGLVSKTEAWQKHVDKKGKK